MIPVRIHLSRVSKILGSLGLRKRVIYGSLFLYAVFTVLKDFLGALGAVLIVEVFTGAGVKGGASGLPPILSRTIHRLGGETDLPGVAIVLLVLFGVGLVFQFGLLVFDGALSAVLRRRIQETVFRHFLLGDWSHMRDFRVGDAVGTNTQESLIVSKYLTSAVTAIYSVLGVLVMAGLALAMSVKISLLLGAIALPLLWIMQKTFRIQARLSKESALLRNEFSADISDRFSGLLQVHVDNNYEFHLRGGLRTQARLTRLDILVGICQAVIGSFHMMLPLLGLIGLSIFLLIMGPNYALNLSLIASVGVLGMRAANRLFGAVASVGNLSRLSGSLYPVLDALSIPESPAREVIAEPVVRVELDEVSYAYGEHTVIDGATLVAETGAPLVLTGPSGKGKTTVANLIAGLYFPSAGSVTYIGASGAAFPSSEYRARVGFVTQDIYLFQGSLRTNLGAGRERTDDQIWAVLRQVDAADFVQAMGGLDTESAEAGRSLSGGQRRRLGIARVLLSGSDVLVFDEVTAGLDQSNKSAVISVIERLSETYVVVVISHEELSLSGRTSFAV